MKIRTDFVTNSSSSSFIIAFHKDCTPDDVKQTLENIREDIKECLINFDHNYYINDYDSARNDLLIKYIQNEDYDNAADMIIDTLINYVWDYNDANDSLSLDDWNAFAREFSSETCDFLSIILYHYGYKLNGRSFKMAEFY